MTHSFPTRRSSDLSGLRSSLRCTQLLHTLIKYLSSSRSPSAKRLPHQWHKHTVCRHHCLVLPDLLRLTQLRRALRIRVSTTTHRTLRSEEHTSELQSLMRISYAVFCLKKTN